MPAEVIFDETSTFKTRISWGIDCDYVQISTQHTTGTSGARAITQYVSEWLVAAGRPPIDFSMIEDLGEVGGEPLKPSFDGWHATLDRASLNKMIRTLRRARDAAFGADA